MPDIRWHDLHHTCATVLLSRGVHPKLVQRLLGHASIQLALDCYSQTIPKWVDRNSWITVHSSSGIWVKRGCVWDLRLSPKSEWSWPRPLPKKSMLGTGAGLGRSSCWPREGGPRRWLKRSDAPALAFMRGLGRGERGGFRGFERGRVPVR
jgi:Phage integrase family